MSKKQNYKLQKMKTKMALKMIDAHNLNSKSCLDALFGVVFFTVASASLNAQEIVPSREQRWSPEKRTRKKHDRSIS